VVDLYQDRHVVRAVNGTGTRSSRVPDSRVLADAGRAGEGQKAASGATLARRVRRKRKIAGAVNLV
jgi:hypothetical protein